MSSTIKSVYTSGDVILEHPVETCTIMLFVICISASLEYLLDIAAQVETKFFRVIFDALSSQITVIGTLSLIMSFGESVLYGLPPRYYMIFSWAQMCLFFMAISLVFLTCIFLWGVTRHAKRWTEFEVTVLTTLPTVTGKKDVFKGKENVFHKAYIQFTVCLNVAGYTQERQDQIIFADYLQKVERSCLVKLTQLNWMSWLSLIAMIILNAVRTKFVQISTENPSMIEHVKNFSSFVGFCGYLPLFAFVGIAYRLNSRLQQYLSHDPYSFNGHAAPTALREMYDPRAFLFWQSKQGTLTVIQIFLIFYMWYLSVFCLSMLYDALTKFDGYNLLIVAAFVPLVIFLYLVPYCLTAVALLSSLGSSLDHEILEKILDSSKEFTQEGKHDNMDNNIDNNNRGGIEEELLPRVIIPPPEKDEPRAADRVHPEKKFVPAKGIEIDDAAMHRFATRLADQRALQDRKRKNIETGHDIPGSLTGYRPPSSYFSDDPSSPAFEREFSPRRLNNGMSPSREGRSMYALL